MAAKIIFLIQSRRRHNILLVSLVILSLAICWLFLFRETQTLRQTTILAMLLSNLVVLGTLFAWWRNAIRLDQAVEALRESEDRYRRLVELSPEAILVHDQGQIIYTNAAGIKLAGATNLEQLTGRSVLEFIHPDYRQIAEERIQQNQEFNSEEALTEQKLIRLNGQIVDIEVLSTSIPYQSRPHRVAIVRDITQRKQAERALKRSEARYRAIVEQSGDCIFLVDVKTLQIIDTSPAFQSLLGYTPEEMLGLTIYDFVARDRENIDRSTQRILEEGSCFLGERRYRRKDGVIVYVEVSVSLISTEDWLAFSVVSRDITERKRTEDALRESEERLRALVGALPDLVFVFDKEGRYVEILTPQEHLLYAKATEMKGRLMSEIMPEEVTDQFLAVINQTIVTGETQVIEYRLDVQAGRSWFEGRTSLMQRADTTELVVWVARDITARKQIDMQRQESEAKFRSLAETTAAAIFIYQGNKNRYVNPAAVAITGYAQAELRAMDMWELIHPEFRDRIKQQGEARERGKPIPPRHEIKLLTKEGQERWVDVTLILIDYEGQKAVLGTAFDITTRKQAEAEREHLLNAEREQRLLAETLGDVFLAFTAQTSREAVLDEILRQVKRVVSYSAANVMLLKCDELHMVRWQGYDNFGNEALLTGLKQPLADYPLDTRVVESRQPLVVPDTRENSEWVTVEESAWIRSFLAVPICLQDRVLGLLRLDSELPHNFSDKDIDRLQPLGHAAAIAFENARLYDTTRQELAERRQAEKEILELNRKLLALQYAGAAVASSLDLSYVINTVTREMINLLDVEGCAISEWDRAGDRVVTISEQGLADWWNYQRPEDKIFELADYPLTKRVLINRQAEQMTISQADLDASELAYMQTTHIKTLLMLPMEFQDRVVGLVEVLDSRVERIFSLDELALAQFLANQAATATENARLYAETNRRLKEQIALHEAAAVISSTLDLDTVLNHIVEQLGMVVDASSAYLCSYDPESLTSTVLFEYFSSRASEKELASDLYVTYPLPRDFTTNFNLLQAGRSEMVHIDDPAMNDYRRGHMEAYGAMTILNIPLRVGGRIIAFAELWESEYRRQFSVEEISLCQSIAQQAAVALENARLYDQARQEIEERKQTEQALQRVVARNEAILNAIPDSMLYFDRNEQLLDCKLVNDGLLPEILKQASNGKNLRDLLPVDFVDLTRQHLAKVFDSREIQVFEYQHGSLLGLQNFEARLVASGPDEVLAIIRNITERKHAEQQAIRTERLAALGRLTATLAHEINNPLQAMQSNLDLILDFPLEPGESEQYLQIIRHEIQRLRDIAQRVLSYAHPKPEPRQEIAVADLVHQVLKLTNKRLEHSGIEVATHFEEVPAVLVARNQLTQVFLNLVINATEALEDDGKLQIGVYTVDDEVAVSFTNNGPIIPEEILIHIFEPFFTTKSEGSGLGLWVSHSLVQQHFGSLTVENLGEERGVIFTVKLPAVAEAE